MNEMIARLRRPRYSPLDLAFFVVLAAVVMALGSYWCITSMGPSRADILDDATMVTPLPQIVAVEENAVAASPTFKGQYELTVDWVTSYVPLWQKVYAPYMGKPDLRYLEIGSYEGGSAVWMLENVLTDPSARMTAIDIFEGERRARYFRNIERSGFADKVTTINEPSQTALRRLPLASFDIIYVDGSHVKSDVLEDAVLCWRLVKTGGFIVFDNYRLARYAPEIQEYECPKMAIDPFVQCFDRQCEVIHNGEQLIIRKRI